MSLPINSRSTAEKSGGESPPERLQTLTRARKGIFAFAIVEVMMAATILALVAVTTTQALLHLNRRAAISRVSNAAKAEALSRIQEVSQCSYNPDAQPAVIPSILQIGTTAQAVDLGSNTVDLGSIPGMAIWTVSAVPGGGGTLAIKCTIQYSYLGRNLSYELFTYKASD